MKLYSWNVNGIRAVVRKGALQEFMAKHKPDIVCLQETKISLDQVKHLNLDVPSAMQTRSRQGAGEQRTELYTERTAKEQRSQATKHRAVSDSGVGDSVAEQAGVLRRLGYEEYWNSADKLGYSGTAIFTKIKPKKVVNGFPEAIAKKYHLIDDKDRDASTEGRVLAAEFDKFWLVTVYTINAKDDLSRLPLKADHWDPAFLEYVKHLQKSKPVVFCGDLNVAHTEDDLANPKPNRGKKGFTEEERRGFQNYLDAGFVDAFRLFKKGNGHYTWWTHWANARVRNIGWRIDYILASKKLVPKIKKAQIHPEQIGSDHCPVSLTLDL